MSTKASEPRLRRPSNESKLDQLSQQDKHYYLEMRKTMGQIARERPDIDTRVYTEFMHDYLDAAVRHQNKLDSIHAQANGVPPDPRWVKKESDKMKYNFIKNFQEKKLPKYGASGQQAWNELGQEMQGPSIFGAAINQIYNKRKGGIQFGGIIGLIAGGLMANALIPGGAIGNGPFAIIATIATAFVGAWLGNKGFDGIKSLFSDKKGGEPKKPELSPAPAREPERTVEPTISPEAAKGAAEMREKMSGLDIGAPEESTGPTGSPTTGAPAANPTQPTPTPPGSGR